MRQLMNMQDLFQMKFIQDARFKPGGESCVFTLSSVKELEEVTSVYLWEGHDRIQAIQDDSSNTFSPCWSPDGKALAYLKSQNGTAQIFIADEEGTNSYQATHLPHGVAGEIAWSPDALSLAFTAPSLTSPRNATWPYRVAHARFKMEHLGIVQFSKHDIYTLQLSSGSIARLTEDNLDNRNPLWSPCSEDILYFAYGGPELTTYHPELHLINLRRQGQSLIPDWGQIESAAWLPDGQGIAFIGRQKGKYIGSKRDLWVMGLESEEPICRSDDMDTDLGGLLTYDMPVPWENQPIRMLIDRTGEHIFLTGQRGGESQIYRASLQGPESWTQLSSGSHSCSLQDFRLDSLLFIKSSMNVPTVLTELNITETREVSIYDPNLDLLSSIEFPEIQNFKFEAHDGDEVEGWLMLPPSGRPPFPTILSIHGGPHEAYGHRFVFDFHLLTGAGYAVAFINQRGSTGYGDAFAEGIHGEWGNLDYLDLMAGIDELIKFGLVDPTRLGVYGLSGGGYLTCWIVTHTDRFAAAISENPVTDWISFFGTSDIGPAFCEAQFGVTPQDDYQRLSRMSPITYANRCKTPTLLIVGESDNRCPPGQSEEFFTALQHAGCPVEMLRFPIGGHTAAWDGLPIYRQDQNAALIEWFGRYLGS